MYSKRFLKKKKVYIPFVAAQTGVMSLLSPTMAYASAEANNAITGINSLVNVAGNIISAIGAFVVLWGIFELGSGMQQHDGAQMAQAGKRIAGGLVMVAAPQLLKLFI